MKKKDAVIIHSGGMDSSICLALAIKQFGKENVLSLSFNYHQRHSCEMEQAKKICHMWNVDQVILDVDCLQAITDNALVNHNLKIEHNNNSPPNTLVVGRNGLMARLGAIHAHHLGARRIYMGVIEIDEWNSGYRDCSRDYMDLMQKILRIDLDDPSFEICTPLVKMTKMDTYEVALSLGVLDFLLNETISCYEGLPKLGCQKCPACILRNDGLRIFAKEKPSIKLPYKV